MVGDWRETTWGELATLEYGKALQGYGQQPATARVFGTNGPIGWHHELLWQGPGVIIGRKGAYRGVHFTRSPYWVIDTAYSLQAKPGIRLYPRWAYYQVKHLNPNNIDDGSPIPSTTRPSFYAQRVSFPPYEEQERIADLLGALDDKIELNRRITETLEAAARALFKSWFVDFDPVHAKAAGRPPALSDDLAALFPAHLGDDGLPEGWASTNGSVGVPKRSTIQPRQVDPETSYIGLEHIDGGKLFLERWGCAADIDSTKTTFRKGDLLFGKLRPYFHKVTLAPFDGICSSDIFVFTPATGVPLSFLALAFSQAEFVAMASNASGGTRMPRADWGYMREQPAVLPPHPVLEVFDRVVSPLLEQAMSATAQSRTLAALRDTLLPKLISGELRIRDAERAVAAA